MAAEDARKSPLAQVEAQIQAATTVADTMGKLHEENIMNTLDVIWYSNRTVKLTSEQKALHEAIKALDKDAQKAGAFNLQKLPIDTHKQDLTQKWAAMKVQQTEHHANLKTLFGAEPAPDPQAKEQPSWLKSINLLGQRVNTFIQEVRDITSEGGKLSKKNAKNEQWWTYLKEQFQHGPTTTLPQYTLRENTKASMYRLMHSTKKEDPQDKLLRSLQEKDTESYTAQWIRLCILRDTFKPKWTWSENSRPLDTLDNEVRDSALTQKVASTLVTSWFDTKEQVTSFLTLSGGGLYGENKYLTTQQAFDKVLTPWTNTTNGIEVKDFKLYLKPDDEEIGQQAKNVRQQAKEEAAEVKALVNQQREDQQRTRRDQSEHLRQRNLQEAKQQVIKQGHDKTDQTIKKSGTLSGNQDLKDAVNAFNQASNWKELALYKGRMVQAKDAKHKHIRDQKLEKYIYPEKRYIMNMSEPLLTALEDLEKSETVEQVKEAVRIIRKERVNRFNTYLKLTDDQFTQYTRKEMQRYISMTDEEIEEAWHTAPPSAVPAAAELDEQTGLTPAEKAALGGGGRVTKASIRALEARTGQRALALRREYNRLQLQKR